MINHYIYNKVCKVTATFWIGMVITVLNGCESVEPKIIKVEDRIKPPYNYALLKEVNGDTRFDYKWSNYDDGYLRVGKKFLQVYDKTMAQMEVNEKDQMLNIYATQKEEIVKRFKQNGEVIQATREKRIINAFTKAILDENESIVETGGEFSVVNDISITVPKLQE